MKGKTIDGAVERETFCKKILKKDEIEEGAAIIFSLRVGHVRFRRKSFGKVGGRRKKKPRRFASDTFCVDEKENR